MEKAVKEFIWFLLEKERNKECETLTLTNEYDLVLISHRPFKNRIEFFINLDLFDRRDLPHPKTLKVLRYVAHKKRVRYEDLMRVFLLSEEAVKEIVKFLKPYVEEEEGFIRLHPDYVYCLKC